MSRFALAPLACNMYAASAVFAARAPAQPVPAAACVKAGAQAAQCSCSLVEGVLAAILIQAEWPGRSSRLLAVLQEELCAVAGSSSGPAGRHLAQSLGARERQGPKACITQWCLLPFCVDVAGWLSCCGAYWGLSLSVTLRGAFTGPTADALGFRCLGCQWPC